MLRSGHNQSYRLDRDECHGIKELLVMLTHLYDDQKQYLIIDEPELNLHPQYQSFFMQEVRKIAGDPSNRLEEENCLFGHTLSVHPGLAGPKRI